MPASRFLSTSVLVVFGLISGALWLPAQETPTKPRPKAKMKAKSGSGAAPAPSKAKGQKSETSAATSKEMSAAWAKKLAPFVDADTILITHIDLSRIDAQELLTKLGGKLDVPKDVLAEIEQDVDKPLKAFLKAGGIEIFSVIAHSRQGQMILVPVGPNQNEAELADVVGESMRWRTPMVQKVGEMLLIGTQGTQDQLRDLKPAERPELEAAFKLAGNSAAQVFLVPSDDFRRKMTTEPAALEQFGAERAKVLADGVQWAVLTADAPLLASWKLTIQSKDAASAKQLQSLIGVAVPQGLGMAVQMASMFAPQAAQFMPNPAELAKAAIPKVTGDRLTLTVDEKNTLVALAMKLLKQVGPGVGRARDTARRTESSNNLKRLGLAFHTTYDVSKEFARGYRGADKKPLLSWRVQLLPAVDEAGLFKEFHLDEPWDSPHNKTLIERMPLVYRSPNMKTDKKGLTTYLVPSGDKTILSGDAPVGIIDVTDGSSNTILVVDVSDENAVIWTKPDDWQYDAEKPMQGLIGHYPDGFQALLVDGSVKFISKDVDVETLKALMTRNAGDKVGAY